MFQIRVVRPNEDVLWQWWVPDDVYFDWPLQVGGQGQLWRLRDPEFFVLPPYKIEIGGWPESKNFWQRAWAWIARRKAEC
jgi:hypothetical protein